MARHRTLAGTPQGGVISPLLSNIYLHVLDVLWTRHSAPSGTLVRYADDFVVLSRTRSECEQAEARIRVILESLGLELHPEKTRRVDLFDGKEGFDFLGCHLHKRMSGPMWEKKGRKLYFLQRWPSQRAMKRVRQRVKELTPRWRCHGISVRSSPTSTRCSEDGETTSAPATPPSGSSSSTPTFGSGCASARSARGAT